jgi:hypothetical protein
MARVVTERPLVLDVQLACRGRALSGFALAEDATARHVTRVSAGDDDVHRTGARFLFDEPTAGATVSYRIELDALAAREQSFDLALRSGATLVAPVSSWLAHPLPLTTDVPVRLRVETPPAMRFETGLARDRDTFVLEAHEIPVATYGLFGRFESRALSVGEARVELSLADGALAAGPEAVAAWVADSARVVGEFWRRFPVPRVHVTVLPVPGRDGVLFGKVLPESAPGVVVLVGERTSRERLYQDWILVHELFHLGVPSFSGEGRWFDEGLATYFEPIIRARAGWRTEESVWEEFRRAMPLGLEAVSRKGLERVEDFGGVYWGGAIVVLLADVEIRRRTGGARGLEDGLRAVLGAGGHASEVWPLDRTLELADAGCGVPALAPLARAHARSARGVDLDALWAALGVEASPEGVRLSPSAPLADVRRSIVTGRPRADAQVARANVSASRPTSRLAKDAQVAQANGAR